MPAAQALNGFNARFFEMQTPERTAATGQRHHVGLFKLACFALIVWVRVCWPKQAGITFVCHSRVVHHRQTYAQAANS